MRTNIFGIIWITACAGLILLSQTGAAFSSETCRVARVEGFVTIRAQDLAPMALQRDGVLERGVTVVTANDGRAVLTCGTELSVIIGPSSEISIEGVLQGAHEPFGLRLLEGVAGFLFDRKDDGVEGVQVRTPAAVAAVRSTEWAVEVDGGRSAFFAREGTVFVLSGASNEALRLIQGQGVDVTPTGIAGPIVRWGDRRIALLAEALGSGW